MTMRHDRRKGADGNRISKLLRDSMESDFARDVGGRIKAFITEQPVRSVCLGLAAGLVLGLLVRRAVDR